MCLRVKYRGCAHERERERESVCVRENIREVESEMCDG